MGIIAPNQEVRRVNKPKGMEVSCTGCRPKFLNFLPPLDGDKNSVGASSVNPVKSVYRIKFLLYKHFRNAGVQYAHVYGSIDK